MKKITIVIPCYNEAESLPELLKQLDQVNTNFNFILVDNGSTDETQNTLQKLNIPKNIELVKKEFNTGYGAGIKFGLGKVKTDYCGWMHADLQQNAKEILNSKILLEHLNKQEEIGGSLALKGLRTGRPIFENLFTVGVALMSSILFFRKFWDIAGQPNIFKTSSLTFLDNSPNDHNFEFYVYIQFLRLHGNFQRFDAPFHKRRFGVSSWDKGLVSKMKHANRIFRYILFLRTSSKY